VGLRTCYPDAFSDISGDMTVGALVDCSPVRDVSAGKSYKLAIRPGAYPCLSHPGQWRRAWPVRERWISVG
jgi:hypothetical protein